jgi:hypothetical protein
MKGACLGGEGWDERRREGAGLGDSGGQGMTVGGRWRRKEGSALANLAAPAAAVAVTFFVCLLGKAASDERWR